MTDGQSLVDKKLQVRANFFVWRELDDEARGADRDLELEISGKNSAPAAGWRSIHPQAGCPPSEFRARHGESATGLAGDSEA